MLTLQMAGAVESPSSANSDLPVGAWRPLPAVRDDAAPAGNRVQPGEPAFSVAQDIPSQGPAVPAPVPAGWAPVSDGPSVGAFTPTLSTLPSEAPTDSIPVASPLSQPAITPPTPIESQRANQDADGHQWLRPYLDRAQATGEIGEPGNELTPSQLPPGFVPWWDRLVREQISGNAAGQPLSVEQLVYAALQFSPYIRAVSTEPHIRRTYLVEESAAFDWRSFLESTYSDQNDPVGNTLTTGNNDDRFTDQTWGANGGFRRRTLAGGEFDFSQRLGHQQNNSRFLVPQPQGTARLELSYSQPLLNGAGKAYNQSRIVLASIDTELADDQLLTELQDHLLKVTQAYWELYRARAEYFQRNRVLQEAELILKNLQGREEVDSLERQVLRAKAAVASRRSEIARATTSIRNAESQLRLLVNDPTWLSHPGAGLTPAESPLTDPVAISVADGLTTALRNRPDISQSIRNLRNTSVRLGVAQQEILPQLDLLLRTYVAGLEGDSRVLSAWSNQFAEGRPGYSIGLQFDVPVGNRAARGRLERRKWEMTRAVNEFRSTVESSLTETEIAIREVHTAYREMLGKYESMLAAQHETAYLVDRWNTLPGIDDSTTLLLEDLLDSQARLADEEVTFVQAQINYAVALVQVRRAMGTLVTLNPGYCQALPLHVSPGVVGDTVLSEGVVSERVLPGTVLGSGDAGSRENNRPTGTHAKPAREATARQATLPQSANRRMTDRPMTNGQTTNRGPTNGSTTNGQTGGLIKR